MLVSLCAACCKPAAVLSSEPLKLPFCHGYSSTTERCSQGEETFPLSQGCRSHLDSFFFLSFFLFSCLLPHVVVFLAIFVV